MNQSEQRDDLTIGSRILRAGFVSVAVLTFLLLSFLLYRFVRNDGHLSWNDVRMLDVLSLFHSEQPAPELDHRTDSRHWSFILTDTTLPILITASNATLTLQQVESRTAFVDLWLEGAAVEPDAYRTDAELTPEGTLSIAVEPGSADNHLEAQMVRATIGKPDGHPVFVNGKNISAIFRDCNGPLTAHLINSHVRLSDLHGPILIETTSGDIHAQRCVGSGHFATEQGRIVMEFNDGRYTASSGTGLSATRHFGSLVGSARIGGITAELLQVNDSCTFTTGTGDINLLLPQNAGIHLIARAPAGKVDQSLIQNDSLATQTRHSYNGRVNGAAHTVRSFSQSGNIRIGEAGKAPGGK